MRHGGGNPRRRRRRLPTQPQLTFAGVASRRDPATIRAVRPPTDIVAAGLAGAALSALPSTALSLARGDDVLDGGRAAGAIVLPRERRTPVLLAAGTLVHVTISLGWAAVLAAAIPRGNEPAYGVAAGLAIAALDLGVIGRRIPAIRALPQGRQWADHVAYGLAVGTVLRARRQPISTRSTTKTSVSFGPIDPSGVPWGP
jgi:hypothetical protein